MDHAEDGNESSSAQPTKKRDALKRIYMFRFSYHKANKAVLDPWIQQHCKRATFQGECGETGYYHWQMTVELKERKRFTFFKHHFLPGVYVEIVRNEDASFDYTNKEESRIEGPYQYPEPVKMPTNFFYQMHCIRKKWQAEIETRLWGDLDMRGINWYWSEAGEVGKTLFARHCLLTIPGLQYIKGAKKDCFHTLSSGTRGVIINLARGEKITKNMCQMLEDLKDGIIFSTKYESKQLIIDPLHVVVFANSFPDEDMQKELSADRWNIVNID